MGVRSYLIKLDSVEQLKLFLKYLKYLPILFARNNNDSDDDNKPSLEQIIEWGLIDEEDDKEYESCDDFDLSLVGFKFWAGGIWGLISTYTSTESALYLIVNKILKCYFTQLMSIDKRITNYENIISIFFNSGDNKIEIYNKIYEENKDKFLDYDKIIKDNNFKNNCNFINFDREKICKAFGVYKVPESKPKPEVVLSSDSDSDSEPKPLVVKMVSRKVSDSELPVIKKLVLPRSVANKKLNVVETSSDSDSEPEPPINTEKNKVIKIEIYEDNSNTYLNKFYIIKKSNINVIYHYNNKINNDKQILIKCNSMIKNMNI